jgi:hypothetical protein
MAQKTQSTEIEIALGPHPARPRWSVLRVSFVRCPEHLRRVDDALSALVSPSSSQLREIEANVTEFGSDAHDDRTR